MQLWDLLHEEAQPSTLIIDNGTNFVGAEGEFEEYIVESDEVQPTRGTTLWRSMGTVGEKLQKSNECSVQEQISYRGRSFNNDVYWRADFERKTVDPSQFRC